MEFNYANNQQMIKGLLLREKPLNTPQIAKIMEKNIPCVYFQYDRTKKGIITIDTKIAYRAVANFQSEIIDFLKDDNNFDDKFRLIR